MDWPFPLPSYSCSEITNNIGVNLIVQGIKAGKKSIYYSLSTYNRLWAPGLQFRASLEITSLSPQFCGTGGYCSAPDIPLKSPFVRSLPSKCLIVRDRHDKRLRIFFRFFLTVSLSVSPVVFCSSFYIKNGRFKNGRFRNRPLKIEILKN